MNASASIAAPAPKRVLWNVIHIDNWFGAVFKKIRCPAEDTVDCSDRISEVLTVNLVSISVCLDWVFWLGRVEVQNLFALDDLGKSLLAGEFQKLAIFSAPAVAHLPIDLFASTI